MKQTKGTITLLLAAYRAILKNARLKNILGAVAIGAASLTMVAPAHADEVKWNESTEAGITSSADLVSTDAEGEPVAAVGALTIGADDQAAPVVVNIKSSIEGDPEATGDDKAQMTIVGAETPNTTTVKVGEGTAPVTLDIDKISVESNATLNATAADAAENQSAVIVNELDVQGGAVTLGKNASLNATTANIAGVVTVDATEGNVATFTAGTLNLQNGADVTGTLNATNAQIGGGENDAIAVNGDVVAESNLTIGATPAGGETVATTITADGASTLSGNAISLSGDVTVTADEAAKTTTIAGESVTLNDGASVKASNKAILTLESENLAIGEVTLTTATTDNTINLVSGGDASVDLTNATFSNAGTIGLTGKYDVGAEQLTDDILGAGLALNEATVNVVGENGKDDLAITAAKVNAITVSDASTIAADNMSVAGATTSDPVAIDNEKLTLQADGTFTAVDSDGDVANLTLTAGDIEAGSLVAGNIKIEAGNLTVLNVNAGDAGAVSIGNISYVSDGNGVVTLGDAESAQQNLGEKSIDMTDAGANAQVNILGQYTNVGAVTSAGKGLNVADTGALTLKEGETLTLDGTADTIAGSVAADAIAVSATGVVTVTGSMTAVTDTDSGAITIADGGKLTLNSATASLQADNVTASGANGLTVTSGNAEVKNLTANATNSVAVNGGNLTVSGDLTLNDTDANIVNVAGGKLDVSEATLASTAGQINVTDGEVVVAAKVAAPGDSDITGTNIGGDNLVTATNATVSVDMSAVALENNQVSIDQADDLNTALVGAKGSVNFVTAEGNAIAIENFGLGEADEATGKIIDSVASQAGAYDQATVIGVMDTDVAEKKNTFANVVLADDPGATALQIAATGDVTLLNAGEGGFVTKGDDIAGVNFKGNGVLNLENGGLIGAITNAGANAGTVNFDNGIYSVVNAAGDARADIGAVTTNEALEKVNVKSGANVTVGNIYATATEVSTIINDRLNDIKCFHVSNYKTFYLIKI